jgi:uncharacterized protein
MTARFIPNLDRLVLAARTGAPLADSRTHGEQHWRAVGRTGLEIVRADDTVDGHVVFLFALLHDARRFTNQSDPEHGPRAAALAVELRDKAWFSLDDERMALLVEACQLHDTGAVSDEPTIGACYDADRLQLTRIGITPDPALLSRPVSRDPEFIERAAAYDAQTHSWKELLADLA